MARCRRWIPVLVAVPLFLVGCADDPITAPEAPHRSSSSAEGSITIEPRTLELKIGDTAWVSAVARDGTGEIVADPEIYWWSTGNGLEVGGSGPRTRIRARALGESGIVAWMSETLSDAIPVQVTGYKMDLVSIDAGGFLTCGQAQDRRTFCWGEQLVGVPEGGGSYSGYTYAPVPLSGEIPFLQVDVGQAHACGLAEGGQAYCWYSNDLGQLGNSSVEFLYGDPDPVPVEGGLSFATLSAGGWHNCALTQEGRAFCWGTNLYAQLGDGNTGISNRPVAVGGQTRFTSISPGLYHTCALTADGQAYCWGYNSDGQLGHVSTDGCEDPVEGMVACTRTPQPVATRLRFMQITAGAFHTCGLAADGRAYCWGNNARGELGTGLTSSSPTPVPVKSPLRFTSIEAGARHTCALGTGKLAYCWGENDFGQNGVDPAASELCVVDEFFVIACNRAPVAVTGIALDELNVGYFHACGITAARRPYCWGSNLGGELGVGGPQLWASAKPVPVYTGDRPWMASTNSLAAPSRRTLTPRARPHG